jgi:hypothetical protein
MPKVQVVGQAAVFSGCTAAMMILRTDCRDDDVGIESVW